MTKAHTDDKTVLESKNVQVTERAAAGVVIGGQTYGMVKQVNLPTLKHDTNETVAIRIDMPIREEVNYIKELVTVNGEKQEITKENVINVVRVTELNSMQPFEYVCNAMTADNLRSAYPEHGYVGKSFAIQKLGVVAGKRYKETKIIEIEPVQSAA